MTAFAPMFRGEEPPAPHVTADQRLAATPG